MCAPKPVVKLILKAPQFDTAFLSVKNVTEERIIFSPPLLLSLAPVPTHDCHHRLYILCWMNKPWCRAAVLRQRCAGNIKKAGYEWRETLQIIEILLCLHFPVNSGSKSCVSCKTSVRLSTAYWIYWVREEGLGCCSSKEQHLHLSWQRSWPLPGPRDTGNDCNFILPSVLKHLRIPGQQQCLKSLHTSPPPHFHSGNTTGMWNGFFVPPAEPQPCWLPAQVLLCEAVTAATTGAEVAV